MKLKLLIIIVVMIFCTLPSLRAQDIHFSHFFSSPLNLNPANTGNFDGDFRFVLNNKNQWMTFTDAYSTYAGSFDVGFSNLLIKKSRLGIGLQVNNDVAGDGRLGTNQFVFNTAYTFPFTKKKDFFAGIGFNVGYNLHGINFNNLYFGNQYSGEQFDPTLSTGEAWLYDRINYFDFGAGSNFIYIISDSMTVQLGVSANHLNTPGKSFAEGSTAYLPVKWSVNLSGNINIKDDLWLEPQFLFMHQQEYNEFNFGALLRFDYNPMNFQSFYFGALVRAKDAGIACFGFKYHNAKFLLSYDINLSQLSTISRGKGGMEFSVIYILLKPRPFESPYYRKCPDFI